MPLADARVEVKRILFEVDDNKSGYIDYSGIELKYEENSWWPQSIVTIW